MTTFNQNFSNLVKATLLGEKQQQIKTETETKINDAENIQDMDE